MKPTLALWLRLACEGGEMCTTSLSSMHPFYPLPSATQWIENVMGWRNLFILVKPFGGVKTKNSHRLTLNSRDTC